MCYYSKSVILYQIRQSDLLGNRISHPKRDMYKPLYLLGLSKMYLRFCITYSHALASLLAQALAYTTRLPIAENKQGSDFHARKRLSRLRQIVLHQELLASIASVSSVCHLPHFIEISQKKLAVGCPHIAEVYQ